MADKIQVSGGGKQHAYRLRWRLHVPVDGLADDGMAVQEILPLKIWTQPSQTCSRGGVTHEDHGSSRSIIIIGAITLVGNLVGANIPMIDAIPGMIF